MTPRIAVIGSGIAGLSTAWLLREQAEVTLFEAGARAGMGAYAVDYESRGSVTRIDIPLRIFCRGYYQNLLSLYQAIGVRTIESDHAGVFADEAGRILLHYGTLRAGRYSLAFLKPESLLSPRAWRLALQNQRFFRRVKQDLHCGDSFADISFAEYLDARQTAAEFVDTVLLPILSVTCTCDYASVLNYPADIMIDYLAGGIHDFGVMYAEGGVDNIVPRLLQGTRLETNAPIASVSPVGNTLRIEQRDGRSAEFDHVVVAAQAHQAAAMLAPFPEHAALLEAIPYESSELCIHTDGRVMPSSASPRSPVGYTLPAGSGRAQVSVDMTRAFSRFRSQDPVYQTWHPVVDIPAERELARASFTRPVVTRDSRQSVRSLQALQAAPGNRLWLCGAYMTERVPLLDAAVQSAMRVATGLGAQIPWSHPGGH